VILWILYSIGRLSRNSTHPRAYCGMCTMNLRPTGTSFLSMVYFDVLASNFSSHALSAHWNYILDRDSNVIVIMQN